jgi:hypothetical protein
MVRLVDRFIHGDCVETPHDEIGMLWRDLHRLKGIGGMPELDHKCGLQWGAN